MRRRIMLLFIALLLTGCWDRREIEERANFLALGMDLCAPDEQCRVRVTRQIAIPGRIPLGAAGEGPVGETGNTVALISATGIDGAEAQSKAQAKLNRRLNASHLRVLLFSEAFARQGLAEFLDLVRRDPATRWLAWIAIVDGKAEDVIRMQPSLERLPALFLNDMFDDAVKTGRMPPEYLGSFLTKVADLGAEPVVPMVKVVGPNRVALAGLAIFRDYRMVGKLSPEEASTYLQLRGQKRGGELIRLTLPDGQEADLTVYGRRTAYRLSGSPEAINVRITVNLESDLFRLSPDLDAADPEVLAKLERLAADQVSRQAAALLGKLQTEWQADILSVGEQVRAFKPAVWAAIPNWPEAFAQTRFEVKVSVRIRRTGLSAE